MAADFTTAKAVTITSTTSPLATGMSTVVTTGPARLYGVYVNTVLSAHTVAIQDYNPASSPILAKTVVTIPASAAAGAMYNFPGIKFNHRIRVLSSNSAATGAITVAYKE